MNIDRARAFAVEAHYGQKWGNLPYAEHLYRVADLVDKWNCGSENVIVAWLHDVVEDTDVSLEEVETLFGKEVAAKVDALTKRRGETWSKNLDRIVSAEAVRVKAADRVVNLGGPGKVPQRYKTETPPLIDLCFRLGFPVAGTALLRALFGSDFQVHKDSYQSGTDARYDLFRGCEHWGVAFVYGLTPDGGGRYSQWKILLSTEQDTLWKVLDTVPMSVPPIIYGEIARMLVDR